MQLNITEEPLQLKSLNQVLTDKISSCGDDGLLKKNLFQVSIFELAQITQEDWFNYLLDSSENNLSAQMRKYYCLNLCFNREKCENAQKLGFVNINIDYPASFLDKVYVIPNRNNIQTPYELFKIH